jgi:hypothetical protein
MLSEVIAAPGHALCGHLLTLTCLCISDKYCAVTQSGCFGEDEESELRYEATWNNCHGREGIECFKLMLEQRDSINA